MMDRGTIDRMEAAEQLLRVVSGEAEDAGELHLAGEIATAVFLVESLVDKVRARISEPMSV